MAFLRSPQFTQMIMPALEYSATAKWSISPPILRAKLLMNRSLIAGLQGFGANPRNLATK